LISNDRAPQKIPTKALLTIVLRRSLINSGDQALVGQSTTATVVTDGGNGLGSLTVDDKAHLTLVADDKDGDVFVTKDSLKSSDAHKTLGGAKFLDDHDDDDDKTPKDDKPLNDDKTLEDGDVAVDDTGRQCKEDAQR
jgi:hypothetical protein